MLRRRKPNVASPRVWPRHRPGWLSTARKTLLRSPDQLGHTPTVKVEFDAQSGLIAIQAASRVLVVDHRDLAVAGAVLIQLAAAGHTLNPELVWEVLDLLDPAP
jgi:hypothetical protein